MSSDLYIYIHLKEKVLHKNKAINSFFFQRKNVDISIERHESFSFISRQKVTDNKIGTKQES